MNANMDIRKAAQEYGVRHWRIAEELGLHEGQFCRMLRHELPEAEKKRILRAIDRLRGGVDA